MIARRDHTVRIVAREDLSPTCFRLELDTDEVLEAVPGQFGMLACGVGLEPLLRRAFSLAGVTPRPAGTRVEVMIKEVGRGTGALRRLPLGTSLRLMAPLGNGFTLDAGAGGALALVAGGIGLPPVLFAAEVLAARGVAFDLYLGAGAAAELIAVERCSRAAAAVGGELVLTTDDGSAHEAGFVTTALERRLAAGRRYRRALGCGPNPMLEALGRVAARAGLDAEVSLEEPMGCGVGVCLGCVVELADGSLVPSCKHGPVFATTALHERWSR